MNEPESIDTYLKCLSRITSVSKAGKDRLLSEVEDHLRQTADDAEAGGMPRAQAEREAIARFGSVEVVADRAALAEAVIRGRHRLRRAAFANVVAAAMVVAFMAGLLAQDQRPVMVVLAAFEIGFCLVVVPLYVRLVRWGLIVQEGLEATLDREARGWLRLAQTLRYQVLSIVLFSIAWAPWKFLADRTSYESQPWRAVVGFGGLVVLLPILWLRQARIRDRAERELVQPPSYFDLKKSM